MEFGIPPRVAGVQWMTMWFRSSAQPRASRLTRPRADYQPDRTSHCGRGRFPRLARAEANLAYLLDHKQEHLAIVNALLMQFDLEALPELSDDLRRAAGSPRPRLRGDRRVAEQLARGSLFYVDGCRNSARRIGARAPQRLSLDACLTNRTGPRW